MKNDFLLFLRCQNDIVITFYKKIPCLLERHNEIFKDGIIQHLRFDSKSSMKEKSGCGYRQNSIGH